MQKVIEEYACYRGIWSAVLLQTLADLRPRKFPEGVPKIKDTGDRRKNRKQIEKAYRKRAEVKRDYIVNMAFARRWIASKSRKPATFLWICDQLDLNPKVLRKLAKDPEAIDLIFKGKLKL